MTGVKKRSLYRGLRYIEIHYIEVPLYLSGLSPSDSFDEALADMIHDGVNDLRNDLAKGHFEKDETKKVRSFNFNRLGSFSNDDGDGDGNEGVKKSIQLCTCIMLFLVRFFTVPAGLRRENV